MHEDIQEAFAVFREMMDDFENWYPYDADDTEDDKQDAIAVTVKIVVSKSWFFGYMFHLGWQMLPRDKTSCQYQDKLLCKY